LGGRSRFSWLRSSGEKCHQYLFQREADLSGV
jgi:hypothetical protein